MAVAERNGAGVTYGWAVVFWDDLLDLAYPNDMGSARKLERAAHLCETQQVGPPDRQVGHLGGYVPALAVPGWLRSSPSGRRHWASTCATSTRLGTRPRLRPIASCGRGAHSVVRQRRSADFRPSVPVGRRSDLVHRQRPAGRRRTSYLDVSRGKTNLARSYGIEFGYGYRRRPPRSTRLPILTSRPPVRVCSEMS